MSSLSSSEESSSSSSSSTSSFPLLSLVEVLSLLALDASAEDVAVAAADEELSVVSSSSCRGCRMLESLLLCILAAPAGMLFLLITSFPKVRRASCC